MRTTRDYRQGARMKAAEKRTQHDFKLSLKHYLRDQTNRGRSDIALGREFGVSRQTIGNWKRLLGLTMIRRAIYKNRIGKDGQ